MDNIPNSGLLFSPEKIEQLDIGDIKPYPANPRIHTDEHVDLIARSITAFGWMVPILVDDDTSIIAGHGRILAARKLGMTHVPAIRSSHLTPEQVRAYRITDNQTTLASEWDISALTVEVGALTDIGFDTSLLGFTADELSQLVSAIDVPTDQSDGTQSLAERFGVPPFSVLNAREGWWQDRKRAWIAFGIRSELGRGGGVTPGDSAEVSEPGLNLLQTTERDSWGGIDACGQLQK